ncbi:hypothetical protein GCM10010329_86880 [Streptomyces spiroverticillatus]|nr:hypothetical protein GCM10010329_86880 [Streptomyces spiroverticillatus]
MSVLRSSGSSVSCVQHQGVRPDTAYPSNLGWTIEIERAAESTGTPPMEMFFSLLDEFRAERDHAQSTPEG